METVYHLTVISNLLPLFFLQSVPKTLPENFFLNAKIAPCNKTNLVEAIHIKYILGGKMMGNSFWFVLKQSQKNQKNKPLGNNFLFSLTSLGLCGFRDTSEIAIAVSQMFHLFLLFIPLLEGWILWLSNYSPCPTVMMAEGVVEGSRWNQEMVIGCHENMSVGNAKTGRRKMKDNIARAL